MTAQPHVSPDGEISWRDGPRNMFGNRGVIHRGDELREKQWGHRHWIVCVTNDCGGDETFRAPGRATELFFLDEATALAAGHRPCFRCRRDDATKFFAAWPRTHARTVPDRDTVDNALHAERLDAHGGKATHWAALHGLPEGTMVRLEDESLLLWNRQLYPWTHNGYGAALPLIRQDVEVLTPASTVAALAAGYAPRVASSSSPNRWR